MSARRALAALGTFADEHVVPATVLAAIIAAAGAVFALHPRGPRITGDSLAYLTAAQGLLDGRGLTDGSGGPFIQFAPGYPVVLAALGSLVGGPLEAAAVIAVTSVVLVVVVAGILFRRVVGGATAVAMTFVVALGAPTLVVAGASAWSEGLFAVLVCALALVLVLAVDRPGSWVLLTLAAVAVWAATVMRYAGFPLVAAGFLCYAFVLPFEARRERIQRTAVFAVAAGVVPALLFLRRTSVPFRGADQGPSTVADSLVTSVKAFGELASYPERFPGGLYLLVGIAVLALVCAGTVVDVRDRRSPTASVTRPARQGLVIDLVVLVPVIVILGFRVALSLVFQVDYRIWSPYFPLVVLAIVRLARRAPTVAWARIAITAVLALWLIGLVGSGVRSTMSFRSQGAGELERNRAALARDLAAAGVFRQAASCAVTTDDPEFWTAAVFLAADEDDRRAALDRVEPSGSDDRPACALILDGDAPASQAIAERARADGAVERARIGPVVWLAP